MSFRQPKEDPRFRDLRKGWDDFTWKKEKTSLQKSLWLRPLQQGNVFFEAKEVLIPTKIVGNIESIETIWLPHREVKWSRNDHHVFFLESFTMFKRDSLRVQVKSQALEPESLVLTLCALKGGVNAR